MEESSVHGLESNPGPDPRVYSSQTAAQPRRFFPMISRVDQSAILSCFFPLPPSLSYSFLPFSPLSFLDRKSVV